LHCRTGRGCGGFTATAAPWRVLAFMVNVKGAVIELTTVETSNSLIGRTAAAKNDDCI